MVRDAPRDILAGVLLLLATGACGDLVGTATLPAGTKSPGTYNTPEGALAVYREAKAFVSTALTDAIIARGALTDELAYALRGTSVASLGAQGNPTDERILPAYQHQGTDASLADQGYGALHNVREYAQQGIGLLRSYAPATSPALRGELYALEGYAELTLGELYCSGVPLSTLDFERDFTYKPGSTTAEVWQHAVALLDTALTLASDSVGVLNLARVLRGRALLDLGDYAAAAQAVASVPDTFRYTVPILWLNNSLETTFQGWTVADTEGTNGLPFVSRSDPRVGVTRVGTGLFGLPLYVPTKYPLNATTPTVLASGVEARLIAAEAALHGGDASWVTILNALRTSCTDAASCPTPAPAGSGGVAGLPPLTDPGQVAGSDSAQVSLVFAERAYWLFLTGHRQGDLRRLVRNYGRDPEAVYPTGAYFGGLGAYGSDVTLPIPPSELPNPLFHGCLDRRA